MLKENLSTLHQNTPLKWCETCLQRDRFNPVSNYCFRCNPVEPFKHSSEIIAKKATLDQQSFHNNQPPALADLRDSSILKPSNLVTELINTETPISMITKPFGGQIDYDLTASKKTSVFTLSIERFSFVGILIISVILAFLGVGFIDFPSNAMLLEFFLVLMGLFSISLFYINRIQERIIVTPRNLLIEAHHKPKSKTLIEIPIEKISNIEMTTVFGLGYITTVCITTTALDSNTPSQTIKFGESLGAEESKWLVTALKYCMYKQAKELALGETSLPDWE